MRRPESKVLCEWRTAGSDLCDRRMVLVRRPCYGWRVPGVVKRYQSGRGCGWRGAVMSGNGGGECPPPLDQGAELTRVF